MLKSRRGDTLIEVLFSITIFALVAVITVNLMNNGIYAAQKSLETTMARNEVDAQAEALRFIHNSYLSERNEIKSNSAISTPGQNFREFELLWGRVVERSVSPRMTGLMSGFNDLESCAEAYNTSRDYNIQSAEAFVLNARLIQPELRNVRYADGGGTLSYREFVQQKMVLRYRDSQARPKFQQTHLYPRIIYSLWGTGGTTSDDDLKEETGTGASYRPYRRIERIEGIWVIPVASEEKDPATGNVQFYDFHIRTCWHSVGRHAPSTIGTVIRLYNPDIIE